MSFWYLVLLTVGLVTSILFLLVAFGVIGPYNMKKRNEAIRLAGEQQKSMNSIQEALENATNAMDLRLLSKNIHVGKVSSLMASRLGGRIVFGTDVENRIEAYVMERSKSGDLSLIDAIRPDVGYEFAENRSSVSPTGRFIATAYEPLFRDDERSLEDGYVEIWPSEYEIRRDGMCSFRAVFDDEDDSSLYVTFYNRLHTGLVVHYQRIMSLTGEEQWEPVQEIGVVDAAPFEFFGSNVFTRNNVLVVASRVSVRVYHRANRAAPWEFSQRLMTQVGAGISIAANDNASVLFISSPYDTVDGVEGAGTVTAYGLQNEDASASNKYYEKISELVSPNGATENAAYGLKVACENNHLMVIESEPTASDPQVLYHYNWSKGNLIQSIPAENLSTTYDAGLSAWTTEKGQAGMLLSERDPSSLDTFVSIYE